MFHLTHLSCDEYKEISLHISGFFYQIIFCRVQRFFLIFARQTFNLKMA